MSKLTAAFSFLTLLCLGAATAVFVTPGAEAKGPCPGNSCHGNPPPTTTPTTNPTTTTSAATTTTSAATTTTSAATTTTSAATTTTSAATTTTRAATTTASTTTATTTTPTTPVPPSPAPSGSSYYVNGSTGSDSNSGSATAPFQTIEHALGVAKSPGAVVYVASGTYGSGDTSSYHWTASGTASAPITLSAAPGAHPVLAKLFVLGGSNLRMTGFKIVRNSYPTDSRFGQSGSNPGGSVGLWLNGCSSCEVDHNEITGQTESGLFVSGSDDAQILANSIHGNGTTHDDHGIYFCSGQNGVLANNVVAHNYDYGIQLYCGTSYPVSPTIVSNTVVYNGTPGSGGSGMVLEAANAQVWNNIVAYNVEFGIRGWSPGSGTISRNDVFANPSGSYYGLSSGYVVSGTIPGDPQFDNVSLADYRLQSTSPAVNAASVAYSPILDMNGVVRPMGSAPDLGAYESH